MGNCEFTELDNGLKQCVHCGRTIRTNHPPHMIRARCKRGGAPAGPLAMSHDQMERCPSWVRRERLAICEECPHYSNHRCDKIDLGCKRMFTLAVRAITDKCPLQKWSTQVEFASPPQADHIVIDCNTHGFGDCLTVAWLAEGAKRSGIRLELHATMEKARLLRMLGQEVVKGREGMLSLHPTFPFDQQQLVDPDANRLDSWRACLGLMHVTPRRPTCTINQMHRESAAKYCARPFAVLCPQSVRANREWPAVYWLELAECLRAHALEVWIICRQGKQFAADRGYVDSQRWSTVAAIMDQARVVVGNDSAPVHLAGLLNVPTVALLGPTTANIFRHLTCVRCVSADGSDASCVGCWFREDRGYVHYPCSAGCAALSNLDVSTVERVVTEHMR